MPGKTYTGSSHDQRPQPNSIGDVDTTPPDWLSDKAKDIYTRTVDQIKGYGIWGSCDTSILAIYATQYARLIEVSKIKPAKRDRSTEKLQNDLTASVLSLSKELGIAPGSRARLRLPAQDKDKDNKLDNL